jgi:PAS domain S-box-containing protein
MTTLSDRSRSLESTVGLPLQPLGRRAVADALPHLVWHSRPDGGCDYVNGEWCIFTGLSQAIAVGDGWPHALHPDDRVRWQAAWDTAMPAGLPCALEYRLQRADGVYRWFWGRAEAVRGAQGQIVAWVGEATALVDRTEQEQGAYHDAMAPPPIVEQWQREQALAPATRQQHAYLAIAGHDMKNQLGVIRGMAQLLERRVRRSAASEPAELLRGLETIQSGTRKLQRLLEELLDLTRLQSDQPVEFNRQPVDLVALARACVVEYAQTTDHALTLTSTVEALVGEWDAARLERVLANLLSNAIKYSGPGSAIQVAIDHDRSGSRDVAVLTVKDQGVGIPAHDLPHIFTPFYRGSNVAHQTAGTGIGLFGARAIVEQQGGTLDLQSTGMVGTTVTLRLPLTS